MDTKLFGGDFALDSRGMPFLVEGDEEMLQRGYIRLKVPKGSFGLDRGLGSNLFRLKDLPDEELFDAALAAVKEALLPEEGLVAEDVEARRLDSGEVFAAVTLRRGGKSQRFEMTF